MRLFDIVYKSLRVRKGKSLFLILGLCIGIVTIITLLSATEFMQTSIDDVLQEQGIKLQLIPKTKQLTLSFNGITVVDEKVMETELIPSEVLQRLRAYIADIDKEFHVKMVEKYVSLGYIGSRETLIVTTDLVQEFAMNPGWQGVQNSSSDSIKVLIGQGIVPENLLDEPPVRLCSQVLFLDQSIL